MNEYRERLLTAQTLDEINAIVESAAFDENLTNDEYCNIYSEAVKKVQTF